MFGPDGRNAVLSYLHSDDNTVAHRLDVARILQRAGLSSADEALVRLLQGKPTHDDRSIQQVPTPAPPRDPIVDLAEEVATCRGEAGLPPVAVTGVSTAQAATIGMCLHNYLCGPSRATLARTLDRCCGPIGGAQKPAFCRP